MILGCLKAADARTIVEVEAEFGSLSQSLADHVGAHGGRLTSVAPQLTPEFVAWAASKPHVDHVARPSLEAMPEFANVDAWLIEGDPNYFTVSAELATAHHLAQRDGKPLLAFLHHVSWPCARRDMYRAPDRIPAHARHPHSWDAGVTLDNPGVLPNRGFRGAGDFAWANHEGGERNGVLTAVEDFLVDVRAQGANLAFAVIPAVLGLGVVFSADAPWTGDVASLLLPFHDNTLIARMEENRLRATLAVMDLQDREGERTAARPRAA